AVIWPWRANAQRQQAEDGFQNQTRAAGSQPELQRDDGRRRRRVRVPPHDAWHMAPGQGRRVATLHQAAQELWVQPRQTGTNFHDYDRVRWRGGVAGDFRVNTAFDESARPHAKEQGG
ncbi:unnamed protein product, partial [Amoebophrya sp. A25]